PGLGRRSHQRHVRAAPGPSLEASLGFRVGRSSRTAGPAHRPRSARGRRSLVEPLEDTPPTERLHAQTLALLERHGVLTREAVAAEPVNGGFSAVYPVL